MVPLTTVANPVAARIVAAHLGAEGIVWELRGNVDGPYPVGPVVVLVAEDDLAVARELVVEQDDEPVPPRPARRPVPATAASLVGAPAGRTRRSARERWLVIAVLLIVAAMVLGRLLTLAVH